MSGADTDAVDTSAADTHASDDPSVRPGRKRRRSKSRRNRGNRGGRTARREAHADDSIAAMWRALAVQTGRLEQRLAARPDEGTGDTAASPLADQEKDARILSLLVRIHDTLAGLTAAVAARAAEEADAGEDLDALRRALAERLARLRDDGAGRAGAGALHAPPSGGDPS